MNNKHIFYYTLECVDDDASDEPGIDTGPDNSENYEKVYHDESEMSSFLPTHLHKKKEKNIIDDEFTNESNKHYWEIVSEPLNEFSGRFEVSITVLSYTYSKWKGWPHKQFHFGWHQWQSYRGICKQAETFDYVWWKKKMKNRYIDLLHTLDSHTGPLIYCTEEEFSIKEVFPYCIKWFVIPFTLDYT